MVDQAVGGTGTVDGDQQVTAIPGRDAGDRLVEHGEVIGGGVGPGAAFAQQQRQRLTGVVTPRLQRMTTPGALKSARRELLIGMRDHQRGVHPDHDGLTQIGVGHPRRWDPAVPFLDQRPHMFPGLRPRPGDLAPLGFPDLVQRTPQRRIRGHRPEQLGLIAQHGQIRQHPATISDQHRGVCQHPAPVMNRNETTTAQRPGQTAGQTRPVGDDPQRRRARVIDHIVTGDFHGQILRP